MDFFWRELVHVHNGLTWKWTFKYISEILLLQPWNLAHALFWLEIWHLHISATNFATDLKLGTHLGWINSWIFWKILFGFDLNLGVWLENGHLYIPETVSATDLKLGMHHGGSIPEFLLNFFLGLIWTCTSTEWFDLKLNIYIYQQILVLEPWNLGLGRINARIFCEIFFWFDLNFHIGHLHISATTFARLESWYTPWGSPCNYFLSKQFFG